MQQGPGLLERLGHIGSFVAGLAAVCALFYVGGQTASLRGSVDLQTRALELENRPYLFVDIFPRVVEKLEGGWELYLGADLIYKNVGRMPASNIETEAHIYNNAVKTDDFERYKEWHIKEHGHFPVITTVFPGQEVYPLRPAAVDIRGGASEYLVTLRVSYTGESPEKRYWYSADMRFKIDENSISEQGPTWKRYGVWLLEYRTDYDAVGHREMPAALSSPYITQEGKGSEDNSNSPA